MKKVTCNGPNPTAGAIRRAFGLLMASGRAANGPELVEGPSNRVHIYADPRAFLADRAGLSKPPVMLIARRMVPTLSRGIQRPIHRNAEFLGEAWQFT